MKGRKREMILCPQKRGKEADMDKMNCDIISDLVPSYLDGICTKATKQCVEEHLKSCDKCRQLVTFYREQSLSGKNMEQKGVDGLKKIKSLLKFQRLAYYLTLGGILLLILWMLLVKKFYYFTGSVLPILHVVCICATLISGIGHKGKKGPGVTDYLSGAVSLGIDIYFTVIFFHLVSRIHGEAETVFGMSLHEIGPFLEKQIIAAIILQGILIVRTLNNILHRERACNWLLCLNLSGIFLVLRFNLWMYMMSERETLLRVIVSITVSTAVIALLGIAASLIIAWYSRRARSRNDCEECK